MLPLERQSPCDDRHRRHRTSRRQKRGAKSLDLQLDGLFNTKPCRSVISNGRGLREACEVTKHPVAPLAVSRVLRLLKERRDLRKAILWQVASEVAGSHCIQGFLGNIHRSPMCVAACCGTANGPSDLTISKARANGGVAIVPGRAALEGLRTESAVARTASPCFGQADYGFVIVHGGGGDLASVGSGAGHQDEAASLTAGAFVQGLLDLLLEPCRR
jgi:hypothetical protein